MRRARLIAAGAVVATALGVAGWFFFRWYVGRAMVSALHGEGSTRIADVFQATLGATLARGAIQGAPAQPGAIDYYEKHPEELQRDKKYFETWHSALLIASSARDREQGIEEWATSTNVPWIPLSNRTDAWSHAFCFRSSRERTVVVSPGPQAMASLDCGTLEIAESDLAKMVPGWLNVQASGALVLVVPGSKRTGN
jgi:hypothetical protein